MEQKEDIFDRLMGLPVLRIFKPFYLAHKEALLYLFFGGVTTLIDLIVFWGFCGLGVNELISNVIAWVVAFIFAFWVNRGFVFNAKTDDRKESARQFGTFLGGRLFSLGCEEVIIAVFITWLGFSEFWVKLAAQIVVVILNYIISKLIVFRKKKTE